MKKTALVIGTGVGMAHIIALTNLGYSIEGICDTNENRLVELQTGEKWFNKWEYIFEECEKNPHTIYSTDISAFKNSFFDIITVAVPPFAQIDVVFNIKMLNITYKKLFIEKPIVIPFSAITDDMYICTEWMNHSKLPNHISNIRMSFPNTPEGWKKNFTAEEDLIPHVISLLIKTKTNHLQTVITEWNVEPYGLFINGKELEWEMDLFEKMYKNPLKIKDYIQKYNEYYGKE